MMSVFGASHYSLKLETNNEIADDLAKLDAPEALPLLYFPRTSSRHQREFGANMINATMTHQVVSFPQEWRNLHYA